MEEKKNFWLIRNRRETVFDGIYYSLTDRQIYKKALALKIYLSAKSMRKNVGVVNLLVKEEVS